MDWLSNNIVTVIGWFLTAISTAVVVSWRLSKFGSTLEANGEKIMALTESFEDHEKKLDSHCTDSNLHTTREQRQAIDARFDRLEHAFSNGTASIEAKIDRLTDRLLLSR